MNGAKPEMAIPKRPTYDAHRLVERQVSHLFGLSRSEKRLSRAAATSALEATGECLRTTPGKYEESFKYLNSNHSLVYVYWLSHFSHKLSNGTDSLATKLYLLNKALHAVDIFFEVEMPSAFFCEHPVGSVMGRADYGDRFFFYQNCTVGGSLRGGRLSYPKLGVNVRMYSGSSILGDAHVGDNVTLGAGAIVKNESVGPNSIVFGQSPNLTVKPLSHPRHAAEPKLEPELPQL